jgi:hypothetical protein
MAHEKDLKDPELEIVEGSEIEALIDCRAVGVDGVNRPIFVNQGEVEILSLTLEDAQRLRDFLSEAIDHIKKYNERVLQ